MTAPPCSCPEVQHFDGKPYPIVLDPDCRLHSYPNDEWRAGSPLAVHAWYVDRTTGEHLPIDDARRACLSLVDHGPVTVVDFGEFMRRFRRETPREVTARLLDELAVAAA